MILNDLFCVQGTIETAVDNILTVILYCAGTGNFKFHVTAWLRLNRLCWFGHVQRMEENRIPKRVLYMNLKTARLRGGPRNRWQDKVREDGRIVGGEGWQDKVHNREEWKKLLRMEGWQEKVHNREEWKKLLRTAMNRHILHMPMEWMYHAFVLTRWFKYDRDYLCVNLATSVLVKFEPPCI